MRILVIAFLIPLSLFSQPDDRFHEYLGVERTKMLGRLMKSYDRFLINNFNEKSTYQENVNHFLQEFYKDTIEWHDKDFIAINRPWRIDLKESKKLMEDLVNSELRRDFYNYGYEDEEAGYEYEVRYRDSVVQANRPPDSLLIDLGEVDEDFDDIIEIPFDSLYAARVDSMDKLIEARRDSARIFTGGLSRLICGGHRLSQNENLKESYLVRLEAGSISPFIALPNLIILGEHVSYENYFMKILIIKDLYIHILSYQVKTRTDWSGF